MSVKAQALPLSVGHWRTIDSVLWDKDIVNILSGYVSAKHLVQWADPLLLALACTYQKIHTFKARYSGACL